MTKRRSQACTNRGPSDRSAFEVGCRKERKETVPTDSASAPLPDQPLPSACPATMRPFPAVPGHPGGVRVPRDALSLQSGVQWERRFCSAPRDCTYTISGHLDLVKGVFDMIPPHSNSVTAAPDACHPANKLAAPPTVDTRVPEPSTEQPAPW